LEKIGFIDDTNGQLGHNVPAILTIYLDQLYKAKEYWKVIQEVELLASKINEMV
jgi:hypothetical protein